MRAIDAPRRGPARVAAAARGRRARAARHGWSSIPRRSSRSCSFDEPVPAGEAVLELAFAGKLRGDLRGLYAARSGERAYAFTQLEAADARRFFPCFDEPDDEGALHALGHDARRHTVLSNQPVERKIEPLVGGRKTRAASQRRRRSRPICSRSRSASSRRSPPARCGDDRDPRLARARQGARSPASRSRPRASAWRGSRRTSTCPTPTPSSTSSRCPTSRPARWRTPARCSSARRCCCVDPQTRDARRRRSASPR